MLPAKHHPDHSLDVAGFETTPLHTRHDLCLPHRAQDVRSTCDSEWPTTVTRGQSWQPTLSAVTSVSQPRSGNVTSLYQQYIRNEQVVSKRNRKTPNRRRTRARADRIAPASLPPGIRIRHATAADLPAVRELTESAGSPLDDELAAAVKAGDAGSALRAGVEGGGRDAFTYGMAEKLHGSPPPPPLAAAKAASLILVAERSGSDGSSDIGEVIGALSAGPPGGVITNCLDQLPNLSPIERGKIVMSGLIFVSKLYAVATVPSARGQGVASALIRYYRDVYARCGYRVLYGEMDAGSGLEAFYRRNGFEIVPSGAALDLYVVFGHEIRVGAGPGERIFVRLER